MIIVARSTTVALCYMTVNYLYVYISLVSLCQWCFCVNDVCMYIDVCMSMMLWCQRWPFFNGFPHGNNIHMPMMSACQWSLYGNDVCMSIITVCQGCFDVNDALMSMEIICRCCIYVKFSLYVKYDCKNDVCMSMWSACQ